MTPLIYAMITFMIVMSVIVYLVTRPEDQGRK